MHDHTFDDLWSAEGPAREPFDPARLDGLPEPARRYLSRCIAPGTRLASAVRLAMHGDIKLGASWCPFEAEQVIRWDRGFVWRAKVKMKGLPISGFDRWVDGEGAMRWRLFGLLPIVTADGPDISRSALGRVQAESVWLPSVLLSPDVSFEAPDPRHVGVDLRMAGHETHLDLALSEEGTPAAITMRRWGNPDQGAFTEHPFGGFIEQVGTFEGYTIPTRVRIGWYVGTERFEPEGEFFRGEVTSATFR